MTRTSRRIITGRALGTSLMAASPAPQDPARAGRIRRTPQEIMRVLPQLPDVEAGSGAGEGVELRARGTGSASGKNS